MKSLNKGLLLVIVAVLGVFLFSCGGDGGTDGLPELPDPGNQGSNGDANEPTTPGYSPGPFTVPGGFGDLRGVAASQDFVYVADSTTLYAFDRVGNLANLVQAPATIQGLAVLPPKPDVDLPNAPDYTVANFPVILHDPVSGLGYISVYPPSLDTGANREDLAKANLGRQGNLPGGQMDPPNPDAAFLCLGVYDIAVDRFGSILVTADIDVKLTDPVPDYPRALQVMNFVNGYTIETGGSTTIEDQDGVEQTIGAPVFHVSDGFATGDGTAPIGPNGIGSLGDIGTDTFFPFNRTEFFYTLYCGAANFMRDYVGIAQVDFSANTIPSQYDVSQRVDNGFGYLRIIGSGSGSAPGSFSSFPAVNPNDGNLEDPDLSDGGPSGIATDPLTDDVFICDPGNRRIQVFDKDTGDFIRQIGDGSRGTAGSAFIAPSSVYVDYKGNIYVCDVNNLRILRESGDPEYLFGSIGGSVKRLDNQNPIAGAVITLGNENGAIDFRGSNINGDYLFTNLLTGAYYLTCTKFNYDSDTTTAQVIADETVRVDFNLNPRIQATTGTYTGRINDANTNLALDGVTVSLLGTSLSTESGSLGDFMILNIPPGSYQVVFSREGYETMTKDIEISVGTVTNDPLLEMVPIPLF